MIEIVDDLPDGVELSEHLKKHAAFYLRVTLYGVPYYIAATPKIRQLLEMDAMGRYKPRDGRLHWRMYDKGDALRDIVSALHLQVRDVVLAGIEETVTNALLQRMREVMKPTVRREMSSALRLLGGTDALYKEREPREIEDTKRSTKQQERKRDE